MKISRGEVVLLDFPFSDATGGKVRPAVVVQNDRCNRRLNSTLVVLITKTVHRARREPTQFFIEVASPAGKLSGLHVDSAIVCTSLYTVHQDFITYRIGRLHDDFLPLLDDCLKIALAIA